MLKDIYDGLLKILGCERGTTKNLKSEKWGHEDPKANLHHLKRKLLPSMIFVKSSISPKSVIIENFHEPPLSLEKTF